MNYQITSTVCLFKALLKSAMKVTKHSNELPNEVDWHYYQSFLPFGEAMKHLGSRMESV